MIASTASMEDWLPELAAVLIVSALGVLLIACMRLQSRRKDRSGDRPGSDAMSTISTAIELEQRLADMQSMIELKTAEFEQLLARAEHVMHAIESSERARSAP